MKFGDYRKSFFSRRFLVHLGKAFVVIAGSISTFLQIITTSIPGALNYGWKGLSSMLALSIVLAFIYSFPRKSFSRPFTYPNVEIKVMSGDILKQNGHLVIGFCDTFDTEIGRIISNNSLQGKFLSQIYSNDCKRLDHEIETALEKESFELDEAKKEGKNKRYKIGTTIVLHEHNRKFFCCAYSRMGEDLKASSNIHNLWDSLYGIWNKLRHEGELKTVAMPVIGTSLARVGEISSYTLAIKLILLSFIINSRIEPISKELVIVIQEDDVKKADLLEIKDFIGSLDK